LTTELLHGRRGKDSLPVHKYNCTKHSVYATLGEAKCVRTALYRVSVIFNHNLKKCFLKVKLIIFVMISQSPSSDKPPMIIIGTKFHLFVVTDQQIT
jgi:hypothetical protein